MLEEIKRKYKNAPELIQYAFLAGGFFLAYKSYKLMFKSETEKTNQELQIKADKEYKAFQKNSILSYPPSQYLAFANTIHNATMYGLGDDYTAVRDTLKLMKNNLDVLALIKAYGERQNYVFGIPSGPKRNLLTNIRLELGDEFMGLYSAKLEDIRADWKKKGILYQL